MLLPGSTNRISSKDSKASPIRCSNSMIIEILLIDVMQSVVWYGRSRGGVRIVEEEDLGWGEGF